MGAGIVSVVSQEGAKHERDGWPCRCRFALVVALIFGLAAVVLQGCSEASNQNLGESLPSARPGQGVWVLGASGDVRSSTDGGVSWRASRLPGDKLHRAKAIAFTDPAHGWIVVLGGVARSVDGGATWLPALRSPVQAGGPATNYGLFAVASSDAGHAWVVGHQGKDDSLILATSDGGRTWREQRLGAAVALWTVSFVNSRHGWVTGKSMSGGPSFVFATRDGGRTWHQQLRSNHSLSGAAFADSRHGWVVGSSDPTGGREGVPSSRRVTAEPVGKPNSRAMCPRSWPLRALMQITHGPWGPTAPSWRRAMGVHRGHVRSQTRINLSEPLPSRACWMAGSLVEQRLSSPPQMAAHRGRGSSSTPPSTEIAG